MYHQVAVLFIGITIKFRNARRIRKLQARNVDNMAERGESTVRLSQEVPFGVRAIEAGCEIDGIWNSKAATPLQAPSQKSISRPPTPTIKPLELPEPIHIVPGKRRIVIGGPSVPQETTNASKTVVERIQSHQTQVSTESSQLGGRSGKENVFHSCEEW